MMTLKNPTAPQATPQNGYDHENRRRRPVEIKLSSGLQGLAMPGLGLISIFIFLFIHNMIARYWNTSLYWFLNSLLAAIGLALLAVLLRRACRERLLLLQMRDWALSVNKGDVSARVQPCHGEFIELGEQFNAVADTLQTLHEDMESQVRRQTELVERKNHALEQIYDVAASINVARDLEELLTKFLFTFKDVVNAHAAAVRVKTDDGNMKLLASIGLEDPVVIRERVLPLKTCTCAKVCESGNIMLQQNPNECEKITGLQFFDKPAHMIAIPLIYRNRTLGVYNLFTQDRVIINREDVHHLLSNIGRHLGMAIDKARQDNEAYRLSIMEERTSLAHELHDSLAQTMASLRFQVRVLDETLHTNDESAVWRELEKIENSLDEAHGELRELITHFRAPIDNRGLIPAVKRIVDRFRQQTDIRIYLQQSWDPAWLPAEIEVQVMHIVQEALTNIRKHSQATHVRVLMQGKDGQYRILIEDDGVGLGDPVKDPLDRHVGLSIMEERARRIHADLRFESEPGEGTQVLLTFQNTKKNDSVS